MTEQKKPNLLLISLDTLRADVAHSGIMPNLTAFFSRGTRFDQAIAQAPLTPVSHASVLTGQNPYNHGIRHLFKERLDADVPTLAQLFAQQGYETGAVVSCPGLHSWYGMNAGFYAYDDEIPKLPDGTDPLTCVDVEQRGLALKRAPLVVERGLDWLSSHHEAPFFLFLHFFDTHWPYEAPTPHAPSSANVYEGEACFMDHHLGRFLDTCAGNGWLDDTLMVIFGDHGEDLAGLYLNDHAGEALGHPEERGHGCLLFEATQHVPLAMSMQGRIAEGASIGSQVRLVDILPTCCDLLGISDSTPRDGASLVPLFHDAGPHRPAYMETFYREELLLPGIPSLAPLIGVRPNPQSKIIRDTKSGVIQVYDLVQDPLEQSPVRFTP